MVKRQKGFTLIELLVVIAIIGILASIVVSNVNNARGKGQNATIKANLANMRAEASNYYDTNGQSYASVCTTDSVLLNASSSAAAVGTTTIPAVQCVGTATGWAMLAIFKTLDTTLPSGKQTSYCVDSNGYAGGSASTTIGAGPIMCN